MTTAEVTIERLGFKGDGIASFDGERILVPLTLPGERWSVRIVGRSGKMLHGRALERLDGPPRRTPPCPVFGRCGGCTLQHLNDETYASLKRGMIEGALRARGLEPIELLPTVTSPPGTRRRIRLAVDRNGVMGFRELRSHKIVSIGHCLVARPEISALFEPLGKLLSGWRMGRQACEISLTLADNGIDIDLRGGPRPSPSQTTETLELAGDGRAQIVRVSWRPEPGAHAETLALRREPTVELGHGVIELPPGVFLQATSEALVALQGFVASAVQGCRKLADLYAGIGALTSPLHDRLDRHLLVDSDRLGLAAARKALPTLETEARDLAAKPLRASELRRFDAAVLDPPRIGAEAQAREIAASRLARVVYVSCDPASFARDAAILCAAGFRIERLLPVDQFLFSPHMELAAELRR